MNTQTLMALMGPSSFGKSTLLDALAGNINWVSISHQVDDEFHI